MHAMKTDSMGAATTLLTPLPTSLTAAVMLDRFELARRLVGMILESDAEVEVAAALATDLALSHLLAVQGNQAEVWQRTGRILAFAVPAGHRMLSARARWVRGLAALGAGDPETALHELIVGTSGHPAVAAWAVADLAEAAVAVGRQKVADVVRASADPKRYGVPSRLECRAAALTAEESDAERLYLAALDGADTAPMPFADARTRFAYGSWLARRRQVAAARTQLARAHQAFAALGADGWTWRVNAELQATGAGEAGEDRYGLTPRERQIAWLAAQGLSNPEIGRRLGISRRTVGAHLHKLFPKVGVASRTQLGGLDLSGAELLPV